MRKRGQTLLEMLVVCGMCALCIGTIFGLWEVGGRFFTRSDAQSVSQRNVLKFVSRFNRESADAASCTMSSSYRTSVSNQDLSISFLSDQDASGTAVLDPTSGRPLYQAWVVYSVDSASSTIRRYRSPLAQPSFDFALLDPTLLPGIFTGSFSSVLSNVVGWQALDFDTGLPTSLTQNPARYTVSVTSLEFALEFRNHLIR